MNPCGMAYSSVTGLSAYYGHTAILIPGRENRYAPEFQEARRAGAELLAYLNPVDLSIRFTGPLDAKVYEGIEAWPYPGPGVRQNYYDPIVKRYYPICDMRAGSPSMDNFIEVVHELMEERLMDGILLDVVGERLWTKKADWEAWPQWEKNEWTYGNVDLVHRIDALRRRVNPEFIVLNNNSWGDTWGMAGERFVNGRMIEHQASTSAYQANQSKRPYGNPEKRRVIALAYAEDVAGWLAVAGGPTHLANSGPKGASTYAKVTVPPPCPFADLGPPPP